jgi:predicted amidohydrolase
MKQEVMIAAIQTNCETAKTQENLNRIFGYVDRAAAEGAVLVVLPEGVCFGYFYESIEQIASVAEPVPCGPVVESLSRKAAEKNVYIVCGMTETENDLFYNTAVFVGPEGYIGKYQKAHLLDFEKQYTQPGLTGFPVFNTRIGKIGLMICWDLWFPECARILALKGADLICLPTGWTPNPTQPQDNRKPMPYYLCMAQAHMNGVYIAAANRVGAENGNAWLGYSVIVGPSGWPIAEGDAEHEAILYAKVDLRSVKAQKRLADQTHLIGDRRRDLYDEMLGTGEKPYQL